MAAVPLAGFVDVIGADAYLILREGTRRLMVNGFLQLGKIRLWLNLDFGVNHYNSLTATTKRRKLQSG
jgi:hypothetical protein